MLKSHSSRNDGHTSSDLVRGLRTRELFYYSFFFSFVLVPVVVPIVLVIAVTVRRVWSSPNVDGIS